MRAIITTAVNKIENSVDFYKRLSFQIEERDPMSYALAKDLIIEINPARYARPGVKFFKEDWTDTLELLRPLTHITDTNDAYILGDGTGNTIYFSKIPLPELPDTSGSSPSTLGNCAGMSLESNDPERTLDIYKSLGFEITMGNLDQGFVVLQDKNGFGVSVMKPNACPHLFFNPSLTFFNGKNNLAVIEKIRESGIPIAEEVTFFNKEGIVDNLILRDPGGYGFFIFSD